MAALAIVCVAWPYLLCAPMEGRIAGTAVNLREGPSYSSRVVMRLPYGTSCRVESDGGEWLRVALSDLPALRGFVHRTSLTTASFPTAKDLQLVAQFKRGLVAPDSFVDWARHIRDLLPDTPPDSLLAPMIRKELESLERWLYLEKEAVPVKYRIWALRLLGARLAQYGGDHGMTDVSVLNASEIYTVPHESYRPLPEFVPWNHEARLPRGGSSFFSQLPGPVLVVHAAQKSGAAELQDSRLLEGETPSEGMFFDERVLIIHLLKVCFRGDRPFQIVRRGRCLFWESREIVPVAVCRLNGDELQVVPTRIQYDLTRGTIRLPGVDGRGSRMLVFFGHPAIVERIGGQRNSAVKTSSGIKGSLPRIEVDFDRDGTTDMVRAVARRFEGTEDPTGSFDLILSFNIEGKWLTVLGQRVKVVP